MLFIDWSSSIRVPMVHSIILKVCRAFVQLCFVCMPLQCTCLCLIDKPSKLYIYLLVCVSVGRLYDVSHEDGCHLTFHTLRLLLEGDG